MMDAIDPLARNRRLSVAPMMDWTDRWCRLFHRAMSRHALLYTEMVTAAAIRHGDPERLLAFDAAEQPVALQIGGSDPEELAHAARVAVPFGYREINLNVGCPSDRVQSGRFGACLMAEPALVAECLAAMREAVPAEIPVTVKSRIGIDADEGYEPLARFVDVVAAAGTRIFIVHARKAILKGLSPKENREIPPLHPDYVRRLKLERPDLRIVLNGGLQTLEQAASEGAGLDGVMLGRAAYHTPWDVLAPADGMVFDDHAAVVPSRHDIVRAMIPVAERLVEQGQGVSRLTRHMTGLFTGMPGSRAWKRYLSEMAHRPGAGAEVLCDALARVPDPRTVVRSDAAAA